MFQHFVDEEWNVGWWHVLQIMRCQFESIENIPELWGPARTIWGDGDVRGKLRFREALTVLDNRSLVSFVLVHHMVQPKIIRVSFKFIQTIPKKSIIVFVHDGFLIT